MDKITHQMRCRYWLEQFEAYAQSGKSKTAWCRENGISDKSFFYWQRILRNESYISLLERNEKATELIEHSKNEVAVPFIEIKAPDTPHEKTVSFVPDAVIRTGCLTLEISNSASPALLQMIGELVHVK